MANIIGLSPSVSVRLKRSKYGSRDLACTPRAPQASSDAIFLKSTNSATSCARRHSVGLASPWQEGSALSARAKHYAPPAIDDRRAGTSREPDYRPMARSLPGALRWMASSWPTNPGPNREGAAITAGTAPRSHRQPTPVSHVSQLGKRRDLTGGSVEYGGQQGSDFHPIAMEGIHAATGQARETPSSSAGGGRIDLDSSETPDSPGHEAGRNRSKAPHSSAGRAQGNLSPELRQPNASRLMPPGNALSAMDDSSSLNSSSSSTRGSSLYHNRITRGRNAPPTVTGRSGSSSSRTEDLDSGISMIRTSAAGAAAGRDSWDMSYSQRIARLRKPALTAADKLGLKPEERARIFRLLRTPRRRVVFPSGGTASGRPRGAANTRFPLRPGLSHESRPGVESRALLPLPLRVFCYGIDDVRLYRALEPAEALGLVVVVPDVESADAVWATRVKRTGKALSLKEISNAARNANKPFVELSAVSAVRVMEAVEALTGWPVPEHLRLKIPPPLVFLPPLDEDPTGSAEALRLLTGGRSLPEYILYQAGSGPPPPLLRELDCTDLYDSREELLPWNPQEREAVRQRPVSRPYMERSRQARQQLLKEHLQRRAEAEGIVPW